MSIKDKKMKYILLIGDWVVDEYWFLLRHHSDISSHTGYLHYRSSIQLGESFKDLCGAGHVARGLYYLNNENEPQYKILGIGKWNIRDTGYLHHLVHSKYIEECNSPFASKEIIQDSNFCGLTDDPSICLETLNPDSHTIRVIRQFHQQVDSLDQINRIDWDYQRSPGDDEEDGKKVDELNLPNADQVVLIAIHDFKKGVISSKLIKKIKNIYPNTKWCVRTKEKNPEWIDIIKNNLELYLVGPEIAALLYPMESWLSKGEVTIQAKDIIGEQVGKNVVLLTDNREAIVLATKSASCFVGQSYLEPITFHQLGWPSAIFASMIHIMFGKIINNASLEIYEEDVRESLIKADDIGRIRLPDSIDLGVEIPPSPSVTPFDWNDILKSWDMANEKLGIIDKRDKKPCLDVWRASTYLPGYLACIEEKINTINNIGKRLKSFNPSENFGRSLTIEITADPGAGKSFLAKCLAKAYNFEFVKFDITQMIHRDDLLDVFDTIATFQAGGVEKILVFVDEINAKLDGDFVFGAFLAPMEEGYYVRDGRTISLNPCVWMFAGTPIKGQKRESLTKISDFESRMNLKVEIDFASLINKKEGPSVTEEAKLEQVYLGVTMIKNTFPDVNEISREVIEYFHNMDPGKNPARQIRLCASALKNVQYGRVTKGNCINWDNKYWGKKRNKQIIRLNF